MVATKGIGLRTSQKGIKAQMHGRPGRSPWHAMPCQRPLGLAAASPPAVAPLIMMFPFRVDADGNNRTEVINCHHCNSLILMINGDDDE